MEVIRAKMPNKMQKRIVMPVSLLPAVAAEPRRQLVLAVFA